MVIGVQWKTSHKSCTLMHQELMRVKLPNHFLPQCPIKHPVAGWRDPALPPPFQSVWSYCCSLISQNKESTNCGPSPSTSCDILTKLNFLHCCHFFLTPAWTSPNKEDLYLCGNNCTELQPNFVYVILMLLCPRHLKAGSSLKLRIYGGRAVGCIANMNHWGKWSATKL